MLFVSYSSMDLEAAEAVAAMLEVRGLPCWMAPRDILAGDDWGAAILTAIETSEALILLFSGHANRSPQVRREVAHAARRGLAILPVRLDDSTPGQAFRLFGDEFAAAAEADAPLDARVAQLTRSYAARETAGFSRPVGEARSPRPGTDVLKAARRVLGTASTFALVVTALRAFLGASAVYLYWTDDLDLEEARTVLVIGLPLHAGSVAFLLTAFGSWLSLAGSQSVELPSASTAATTSPSQLDSSRRTVRSLIEQATSAHPPNLMVRLWSPLRAAVLTLTAVTLLVAAGAADDSDLLVVLWLDVALTVAWLALAALTASIASTIDRTRVQQGGSLP